MTNKEFIEELSRRLEKTEKETASLLASFTECVSQSLQENKTVVLQDFGSFEVGCYRISVRLRWRKRWSIFL